MAAHNTTPGKLRNTLRYFPLLLLYSSLGFIVFFVVPHFPTLIHHQQLTKNIVIPLIQSIAFGFYFTFQHIEQNRKMLLKLSQPPENFSSLPPEVQALLRKGKQVEAVLRYRLIRGVSLSEAKKAIDSAC